MLIGKLCKLNVVTASVHSSVYEIVSLMKKNNIGDVIIINNEDIKVPVGIITDRDIVIRVVADAINPKEITAGDIMSNNLLILNEYQSIQEAIDMMCAKGVRRAPVVNDAGALIGIISVDDLVLFIVNIVESYGKLIRKQISIT